MPGYGPEILGPPQRDPEQQFWDPEIQTMDPEKLAGLQEKRLRDLVRKVLDTPVPLFARKLADAGISSADDLKSLDDIRRIPLTVKQDLRDSERQTPLGGTTASRTLERRPPRHFDRDNGYANDLALDQTRSVDRVRVRRQGLVAIRTPSGDDRHPRPPRLPLRRRVLAIRVLRVLRVPQHLGARLLTPMSSPNKDCASGCG